MEEQLLKIIENTLNSLDNLTIWLFSSFIVVLISLFAQKDELSFASFTINRKYAGVILYLMLCGLTFNVFKLLNNLSDAYLKLLWQSVNSETPNKAVETIKKANLILHNHTWVFNPFSQTVGEFSDVIDNMGYPMLITIWWFGNALAQVTLSTQNKILRFLGLTCAGIYLLLGLGCMLVIGDLTSKVCNSSIKSITPLFGIGSGAAVFFVISFFANKQHSIKSSQHNIVQNGADIIY